MFKNLNYKYLKLFSNILNAFLSFPILFLFCFLFFNKNILLLFFTFFSLLLIGIDVILIKNLIKKNRPGKLQYKKRFFGNHYSFPSGHLSSNISLFFSLTIIHNKYSFVFLITSLIIIFYKLLNKEHDFYDLLFAIFLGFINSFISIFLSIKLIKIFL